MTDQIPILDLSAEIDLLWDDLNAAIQRVLRSGHFIMGPEVEAFESEAAAYLGVKHAIGVNSGTDALVLALRALDIGPGDQVITSAFSFVASAEAITQVGAEPVFADIDPATFNLDPQAVEQSVAPATRAIIPVHLFGRPADMKGLMSIAADHGLAIIEDCAQAFGAAIDQRRVGSFGEIGAFSFFPTKNLGAYGDGGLVTTDDDQTADTIRMLRAHGSRRKYENEIPGYNSRLDAMQAAILRVKLPHIESFNEGRRRAAAVYDRLLADLSGLITPGDGFSAHHVYHQYTVRVPDGRRDHIKAALDQAGIGSMIYYPIPIHRLPVYADLATVELPHTECACAEVLSLPIWPQIAEDTQIRVVETLRAALQ